MAGRLLASPGFQHALRRTTIRVSSPHSPALHRRNISLSIPVSSSSLRTAGYTLLLAVSAGLCTAYYFDARSAVHRYLFMPVLRHAFDAETGHKLAIRVLRSGLAPLDPVEDDPSLQTQVFGRNITNPVGLAAGFDKDGEAIDDLFNLGFSWVEIGSVTPKPQPGNAKPRVFRLASDSALINRYGFPSQGATAVIPRLRARIPTFHEADVDTTAALRPRSILAVNLGKNKTSAVESSRDFVTGVKTFGPYADVLVINISSPNTPGLRSLQNRELLESLLADVTKARDLLEPSALTTRRPRLVLKIAPDLQEAQVIEMAKVIRNSAVDGVIVGNTTITRPSTLTDTNKLEIGGLSGKPLKLHSLQALKTLRAHLPSTIPLIGCGGISSGADALEYARAGASLVQVYTGFGYDGVGTCRRIKDELISLLKAEGQTWRGVVDEAVETLSWKKTDQPMIGPGELTVGKLIEEAEELKVLLDRLMEKTD